MAFKLKQSSEGYESNLALFTPKPTATGIEKIQYVEYRPVTQVTQGSPIEFNIPGSGMDYLDLKKTRLHVKARILRPDGNPVTEQDQTSFINLPLATMFRQCDCAIQQIVITPSISTNYPYKAMIDALINNAEDSKETQLQSQLYFKDTAGYMDSVDPVNGANYGLVERYSWTRKGTSVDLEGPLYIDIMQQERLLLNGMQVNIVLYPAANNFCLMSDGNAYKVDITDIFLKVCTVSVNPGVIIGHNLGLQSSPALYPFDRSDMKVYSVPSGLFNVSVEDPFLGQLPTRLVVALVASEAFNGSYTRNPFNFANMGVGYMAFYVDSESRPGVALRPNFNNRNYVGEYLTLFTGTGKYGHDVGNYITRSDYSEGYAIYIFDLSTTHEDDVVNLSRRGHTRLSIQFSEALPEPVSVIMYATFPSTMQVSLERNITIN